LKFTPVFIIFSQKILKIKNFKINIFQIFNFEKSPNFEFKKIAKFLTGIKRLISQLAKAPHMVLSKLYYRKAAFIKTAWEKTAPFDSTFALCKQKQAQKA
jgi:hypothetical protein